MNFEIYVLLIIIAFVFLLLGFYEGSYQKSLIFMLVYFGISFILFILLAYQSVYVTKPYCDTGITSMNTTTDYFIPVLQNITNNTIEYQDNFVPLWINQTYLGKSVIYQDSTNRSRLDFIMSADTTNDVARLHFQDIHEALLTTVNGVPFGFGDDSVGGEFSFFKGNKSGIHIVDTDRDSAELRIGTVTNDFGSYQFQTDQNIFLGGSSYFGDAYSYLTSDGSIRFNSGANAQLQGYDLRIFACSGGCPSGLTNEEGSISLENRVLTKGDITFADALNVSDVFATSGTNTERHLTMITPDNTGGDFCISTGWERDKYTTESHQHAVCIHTDADQAISNHNFYVMFDHVEMFRMDEQGKLYLMDGTGGSGWLQYNGSCIISSNGGCI